VNDLDRTGLGLIWQEMLEGEGYTCLADLAAASDEELLAIPGLGPFKLRMIRRVAPHQEGGSRPASTGEGMDALDALSH
jgi:predicted flap endonuclease-1-like 5' DNA nuclease